MATTTRNRDNSQQDAELEGLDEHATGQEGVQLGCLG